MTSSADMTCHELMDLVTAYLDGALSREERGRFDAHHRGCARCQSHLSQIRVMVSALGQLERPVREDLSAEHGRMLGLFRTRGLHHREHGTRDVPLGLGSELAAIGDHIGCFWESEHEFDAIAGFLAAGASLGEACVLIGHDAAYERMLAGLARRDLNVGALMQENQLQVASVRSSAEGLLFEVDQRIKEAVHRGMPTVRILGNLNWGRGTAGWPSDREIMRLEAHITSAAERLPCIVVCAYDVTTLPGPMLLKGGLECHPLTFRRDCLRHNEHHVPPERFLEELSAGPG
jgi:DcmR-like sensory protein/putative zinc finger protein